MGIKRTLRAWNQTRRVALVTRGELADHWWARLRGLLGHAPLQAGEGLLLRGEKAIHTFGMGFAIDVLFLDAQGRIVQLIPAMGAWRASPFVVRAANVLELPAGVLAQTGTQLGDQIEIALV